MAASARWTSLDSWTKKIRPTLRQNSAQERADG